MLGNVSGGAVSKTVKSSIVGRIGGTEADIVSEIVLNMLRKPEPPAYALIAPGSGVLPCPDETKNEASNRWTFLIVKRFAFFCSLIIRNDTVTYTVKNECTACSVRNQSSWFLKRVGFEK